jgi:putative ABC transport system permease protein
VSLHYSLSTLWHDRWRFLPGVLAVAFSALLIYLQWGLLLGLFSLTSVAVDNAPADIWVGHPLVLSVDLGRNIPERWRARLEAQPEVVRTESFLLGIVVIDKPDGRSQICSVVGSRLDDDALGAMTAMPADVRARLSEPGSVAVDEAELGTIGLNRVGDMAEVLGQRVRLVGTLPKGSMRSLATPYLLCSLDTARMLFNGFPPSQSIFLLAKCRNPADAPAVVRRLREQYPDMSAYTKDELAERTRVHWLTESKAGVAAGWTALLGLLIGLAITAQTLYAATAAARREFAVLEALGVARWRVALAVLAQSFWVGLIGVLLAVPAAHGLAALAESIGARVILPTELLVGASAVTLVMALLSGLASLRSLRLAEPAQLLR